MSQIIDLDVLVPDDKTVKFGGTEYRVPGDMPLETYLRVQRTQTLQNADASETDILEAMVTLLCDLLAFYHPGDAEVRKTLDKELRRRGVSKLIDLLSAIYPPEDDEVLDGEVVGEGPTEAAPTTPTPSSTSTTTESPAAS